MKNKKKNNPYRLTFFTMHMIIYTIKDQIINDPKNKSKATHTETQKHHINANTENPN